MSKFSKEEKMSAVKRRLEGKESYASIAGSIGADRTTIKTWVLNYEAMGEDAFIRSSNRHYTLEEKNEAVKFYLEGKGSLSATCKKFKIPSAGTLRRWIKVYNDCELKASPAGGKRTVMIKGRKTTLEERIAIVENHIKSGSTYDETAQKYNVSYQQIYQWYHKYMDKGVDGLRDGRDRTRTEEEMSELEKLKAENRLLKAELENRKLENLFLKKVKEIERRRF